MDKKVIPLYITDSLAALVALATKDNVFKYLNKSHKLKNLASKMKAELLLLCREDQEKCYILAKRYVLLMDHLFKVSDDPKIYSHFVSQ
ncbi:unnamed protein product [Acanthoscelides obtectus]|uniref:Uncharacterized protein n=1 Tax=Acanthoscelides obtectus TaxID=200917 RepID=A0A9P0PLW7_ACAOB|nr:unnamed protein product [Acanthoscelides obtectus]CAK1627418.1 hypothetical protein AOBTE_LOCUS4587 [Acanthoscelides obtectus]